MMQVHYPITHDAVRAYLDEQAADFVNRIEAEAKKYGWAIPYARLDEKDGRRLLMVTMEDKQ